jgi:hypothetical protein
VQLGFRVQADREVNVSDLGMYFRGDQLVFDGAIREALRGRVQDAPEQR